VLIRCEATRNVDSVQDALTWCDRSDRVGGRVVQCVDPVYGSVVQQGVVDDERREDGPCVLVCGEVIDLFVECGKVWYLGCCLHIGSVDTLVYNALWVVSEISKRGLLAGNQETTTV